MAGQDREVVVHGEITKSGDRILEREGSASGSGSIARDGLEDTNDAVAIEKRILRKIDLRLLPLMFITYNFNFMDKTILSNASVFGLREANHLHGSQYSWVSSVFYFGYLFWSYPTTLLIQKLPTGKYVGINTLFWGLVVAITAVCHNFGGLMTVRVLLGVAEATISPAFLYVTSSWYTRAEIPTRVGVWFAGNSLGGLFASFISFGIGHITHPLEPWRWLFIILGVATFLWGIPMLLFLPDSISSASFLTAEEKEIAGRRVEVDGTGKARQKWSRDQALECLRDPKTYFFLSISLLTQIPNGGTQNFGNLVLKGFGFTSLQTTLVTLPASVIAFSTIFLTGRLASRFPNISLLLICLVVLFPVTGSAIIHASSPSRGIKLMGYYFMATGPGALPLSISLVGVNYKGETKKMTMTAILFAVYCAGNIAGPHFFNEDEAPTYQTAFEAIMICYALVILVCGGLKMYLTCENRRRDTMEGAPGTEQIRGDNVQEGSDGCYTSELTDWNTPGFRYRT